MSGVPFIQIKVEHGGCNAAKNQPGNWTFAYIQRSRTEDNAGSGRGRFTRLETP
ncbi:hypothetical protein AC578_778 [Pseudocercospora eumusae]|uniref:Uncharacterized protein n=1 Tax=Pseudocercospora eumusae TaxID=321146 RepID=A0A139HMQ3_9PEZI|nr:hypothetical protein AC578_778 [Pseudocercospora eumusae]